MAKTKQPTAAQIKKLQAANKKLQAQLNDLQTEVNETVLHKNSGWRLAAVIIGAGLATAILVVGSLLFWTGRTLIDTNRYMQVVGPLIEQPAVRQAVADQATEALFANLPVEQIAEQALPPRAAFLAPSLAEQLESFTNNEVNNILASDGFKQFWLTANRQAQSRFVEFLRTYEGDGTIDLTDVYYRISDQLQGTSLGFLADKPLPAQIGDIQVLQADWLPTAHTIVKNIELYRWLTIISFIVISGLVVVAARNRRRTVIRLSLLYGLSLILTLVSLRLARYFTLEAVAPAYQAAAGEVWNVITASLKTQLLGMVAGFGLIALVGWVSGPSRGAQALKRHAESLFAGQLHQSLFGSKSSPWLRWLNRNRRVLQWLSVAAVAIWLVFAETTLAHVLWAGSGLLLLVLVIEVLAGPSPRKKSS